VVGEEEMSNRHWKFIDEDLLSPLNDKLAMRHGAEFYFKVPESSFDWDAEIALVKDRSGNKLREEYISAWFQPSLVGPEESTVHTLGVRITWDARTNKLKGAEVSALMSAVDRVLGSPLKRREDEVQVEEAPPKAASVRVATARRLRHVVQALAAEHQEAEGLAQAAIDILQRVNDAKLIDSKQLQQVEVQQVNDDVQELLDNQSTALFGTLLKLFVDTFARGESELPVLYDAVSRLERQLRQSVLVIGTQSGNKMNALKEIDDLLSSLRAGLKLEALPDDLVELFKSVDATTLVERFERTAETLCQLREKLPRLRVQNIAPPQQVKQFVEEIVPPETPPQTM
jgi:hypothetical protein